MDPANIVPPIVYLASDRGASTTGKVVGVTGNKITMWRQSQWEASIYYEKPFWDIDRLFQEMPATLQAIGVAPPPQQFP